MLLADIDATCSSIGYFDGTKYYIEDDTLQSLKVRRTHHHYYYYYIIVEH